MVRIKIILALCLSFSIFAQKDFTTAFPLKWETKIGVSTYRTNMVLHEGKIFIGSNGLDRNFKNDNLDGVYEIDAKTGKIVHHYEIPFLGDNDVNGVAIGDGKLFFGTDNYYFFCFDIKTKEELWKYHLPYDVESCPQLADLNGDNIQDAAFSVEGNGFYALNGKDGSLIWLNDVLTAHSGNLAPLQYDVNGDGVADFITSGRGNPNSNETAGFKMKHYGDYNLALNGKTGEILWAVETAAGVHASPFLYKNGNKVEFVFLDSYGDVSSIDVNGKLLKKVDFDYGQFSSPHITKDKYLVVGSGSLPFWEDAFQKIEDVEYAYLKENITTKAVDFEGKLSASTMSADVLGNGKDQLIGITENGMVFISKTDGTLIQNYKIPSGAEASAFIADVDKDGFLEIVISDLAGNLRCYKTKSKAKATYGSFR